MTTTYNSPKKIAEIKSGFIDAMYFADSDVCFGEDDELDEYSHAQITEFLQAFLPCLPAEIFEKMTTERVGQDIYYELRGHGTGFWDENGLSQQTKDHIQQSFETVYGEVVGNFEGEITFLWRIRNQEKYNTLCLKS